jgi:spermidine synthase
MNTLGSCLGIVFFTLVGYEFNQDWNAFLIATGLVALLVVLTSCDLQSVLYKRLLAAAQLALIAFGIGLVAVGLARPYTLRGDTKTFWGRDGVVEVDGRGQVRIDGLWHSVLSDGKSHVGEVYSWMMAFVGVFSRADQPMTDAMVVGNGVGLTATTLSRVNGLKVDTYEINHTFKRVLSNFPEGTLEVATNPQVNIMWRDARTGMALDPKSYDIIISAPLYLTQAGSSLLLSREYLTLAKSRLKPGGVFVMYSHEGVPEQALLIQHTVRKVFLHARTFFQGLVTVASDAPIEITEESIAARLERPDPFYREAAAVNRILEGRGTALHRMIDPIEELIPTRYLVTDDHPLVEYPDVAARLMRRERLSAGAGSPQRPLAGR